MPNLETTPGIPDTWAIVELMGHVRTAGRLTEEERFGAKMGRLDVPVNNPCSGETDNWCPKCGRCTCPDPAVSRDDPGCKLHSPASPHAAAAPKFVTQYFGGASVYRITFVDEQAARAVAAATQVRPVHSYEMPKAIKAAPADGPPVMCKNCHHAAAPDCDNGRCVNHCEERCDTHCERSLKVAERDDF